MCGERFLPASRQRVWAALNDPAVLRQCIPGCEDLARASETEFVAKVLTKVGPVRARFTGRMHMRAAVAAESCRLEGEGTGGIAGFAKGAASVTLADEEGGTRLRYQVDGLVGGKLAQIGARLIDATAKKMADEFFDTFTKIVAAPEAASTPDSPASEPPPSASGADSRASSIAGNGRFAWALLIAGLVAVALLFSFR
jgi:uncharacterized protein